MHLMFETLVKQELDKLLAAKIIFPVRHIECPFQEEKWGYRIMHRFPKFRYRFTQRQLSHPSYGVNPTIYLMI